MLNNPEFYQIITGKDFIQGKEEPHPDTPDFVLQKVNDPTLKFEIPSTPESEDDERLKLLVSAGRLNEWGDTSDCESTSDHESVDDSDTDYSSSEEDDDIRV